MPILVYKLEVVATWSGVISWTAARGRWATTGHGRDMTGTVEEGCQVQLTRTTSRLDPVVRSCRPGGGGEIVVTGAHGGAGASTLAVLLHPAWDMGVICRPGSDCPQVRTGGRPRPSSA